MSKHQCIVAADVGNSAVKICVLRFNIDDELDNDASDHVLAASFPTSDSSWQSDVAKWVQTSVGCDLAEWRIASVQRNTSTELLKLLESARTGIVREVTVADIPMSVDVDQPDRVGVDRVLGAYAATNRIEPPFVIVDAGSAITVDYVDENAAYRGGAIMPGLQLQMRSLAAGTDALPDVGWNSPNIPDIVKGPATNTADAIQLGVIMGAAGAIERLASCYQESSGAPSVDALESNSKTSLVITGGDSATISPHLRIPHASLPNSVCLGLLDLATFG